MESEKKVVVFPRMEDTGGMWLQHSDALRYHHHHAMGAGRVVVGNSAPLAIANSECRMTVNGWRLMDWHDVGPVLTLSNRCMYSWKQLGVEDLAGIWKNADGIICRVMGNRVVIGNSAPIAIEMSDRCLMVNGWKLTDWRETGPIWTTADGRMDTWEELGVEDIAGIWMNSEGKRCHVKGDRVVIGESSSFVIGKTKQCLTMNGWRLTDWEEAGPVWTFEDHRVTWRALEVEDLIGIWINSVGERCRVSGNRVHIGESGSFLIGKSERHLILNGWKLTEWQKAGPVWTLDDGGKVTWSALPQIGKRRLSDTNPKNECVVCCDSPKTHAFVPCGHRCVCGPCASAVMNVFQKCPICRSPATAAVHIFD